MSTDHESQLIGLTDPFSSEAARAQYPDQGAGRTLSFQQRKTFTLTSDSNGNVAMSFNPKVSNPALQGASIAGTTVTWPAAWIGDFSTNLVNTYGKSYRPTSYGVRINNTLSATDSAGYLAIAKGGIPTVSTTTTMSPDAFTHWDVHGYLHGGEWHSVGSAKSANSYDFKDITLFDGTTEAADDTWETIYVAVFGTKVSATVAIIELYINYEYTPREDAPIAQLAVPQPVMSVQMQTAVNQVSSAHGASHGGGKAVVTAFIKREGKKALLKHVIPFLTKKAAIALA